MGKNYIVKITRQAQTQIEEIVHYIAYELCAKEAALNLLDLLEDSIKSLSQYPNRVTLTVEEPWHNENVRKLTVKNFFIYFWIDEQNNKVQVVGVVYKRRNQKEQLRKINID